MPPMPGAKLPAGPGPTLRVANRDRQKVTDMVKRRLSTRYVTPGEAVGGVPPIPVMPNSSHLPESMARRAQAVAQGQGLDVDLDVFRAGGFDPEQCGHARIPLPIRRY